MLRWVLALCLAGASFAVQNPPAPTDADRTVEWIAKTLERLGEKSVAKDFRQARSEKRVEFGVIRDYGIFVSHDTNAVVGAGKLALGGVDTNVMTIRNVFEGEGPRVNAKRPYGQSSRLVSLAGTVFHEMIHMGQTMPEHELSFEEPAWRETEKAYGRWLDRLSAEVDLLAKAPKGKARSVSATEVADLVRHIRTDLGTLKVDQQAAASKGKLTPNRHWQWDNWMRMGDHLLRRIESLEAGSTGGAAATLPPLPKGGAWLLFSSNVWSDNPNLDAAIEEYRNGWMKLEASVLPGVSRHSWVNPHREGTPRTSLTVMWTVRPDILIPGGELQVDVTAADSGSSPNAGDDWASFGLGLFGSDDDKNWTFVAGNLNLYARPKQNEKKLFRIPAPGRKFKVLSLNVSTGNPFWGKVVSYRFLWKEGPLTVKPAPAKAAKPPTKRNGRG